MTPEQEHHTVTFAVTTGPGWLRLLVVAGVVTVTAFALVRPFVPAPGHRAHLAVTITAGTVALLLLLLGDGLDVPQQAVVFLLVALVVPLAVSRHAAGQPPTPVTVAARRGAPWMVLLATACVLVELGRAWSGDLSPDRAEPAVHTAVLVGAVGLAWLVLCRPHGRRWSAAVHAVSWVLATAVLAGTTALATAGIPT